MNEEIKEILDDLDYAKNKQRGTITLNQKDIETLLDYITNLQQENERLKLAKDTKSASEIICENLHDVYKARCYNAIEYVKWQWKEIINNKNYKNHLWTVDGLVIETIIDILNGDDKE